MCLALLVCPRGSEPQGFGAALPELHHNSSCTRTSIRAAPQVWSQTAGAFKMSVLWKKSGSFLTSAGFIGKG